MYGFWRLISFFICLSGFLIAGGILLFRGESFLMAVVRAIAAFAVLYIVQNMLGAILLAVVDTNAPVSISPANEADELQAQRN